MSINETNLTAQLNDSSKLKLLLIEVNGIRIRQESLFNLQVNFNPENGKTGVFSYTDVENINELSPITTGTVLVKYIDALGIGYEENFAITKVEVSRLKKNQISTMIFFEELIINRLRKSYISIGFKDKTFGDMLKTIFETLDLPVSITSSDSAKVFQQFVVPKNISIYEFLCTHLPLMNMRMYSTKQGLNIVDKAVLAFGNFGDSVEQNFVQGADTDNVYWNIKEYKAVASNPRVLLDAPYTEAEYINDHVLALDTVKVSIETAYATQELNGSFGFKGTTIANSNPTYGSKAVSSLYFNLQEGIDIDYRDVINSSQDIKIKVQGLNIDRMYTPVNITLDRAPNTSNGEGDEVFSGKFIVTSYVDSITSGVFTQMLTLSRSDFMEGNPNVQ